MNKKITMEDIIEWICEHDLIKEDFELFFKVKINENGEICEQKED